MTCIAGLEHEGKVWIGGDSAGVDPYLALMVRADEKVFTNGEAVFGFTGSYRMGQLLRHSLAIPKPREGVDPDKFMVTDFVDAVRDCLKAGGWATKASEQERGGFFLIGFRGRLYDVESDYQVGRAVAGINAAGSGSDLALGSLHATAQVGGLGPDERIKLALSAAETYNAGVRGPFLVLSA